MRPRYHDDHALLAAVAERLLSDRVAAYAERVAAGGLAQAKADDALRVYRAIAGGWDAIAAIAPAPDGIDHPDEGGAWPFERRDALDRALHHARAQANASDDFDTVAFADAVAALRWWEDQSPSARFLVDVTIEGRRRANANPAIVAERAARARRVERGPSKTSGRTAAPATDPSLFNFGAAA